MKRQLGIVALIACMILATVPTALCATQNGQGQNQNYDISVTVSDTNAVKTITMEKGEILRLIIKNVNDIPDNPFDPNIQNYFTPISFNVNAQNTMTGYIKAIAVSDGYLINNFIYQPSGNTYTLKIKVISQNN